MGIVREFARCLSGNVVACGHVKQGLVDAGVFLSFSCLALELYSCYGNLFRIRLGNLCTFGEGWKGRVAVFYP